MFHSSQTKKTLNLQQRRRRRRRCASFAYKNLSPDLFFPHQFHLTEFKQIKNRKEIWVGGVDELARKNLGRRFRKNNLSAPKIALAGIFICYSKNLNFVVTKTQSSLIVRSSAAEDLEWVEEAEEEEEEKWLHGEQVGLCKLM